MWTPEGVLKELAARIGAASFHLGIMEKKMETTILGYIGYRIYSIPYITHYSSFHFLFHDGVYGDLINHLAARVFGGACRF